MQHTTDRRKRAFHNLTLERRYMHIVISIISLSIVEILNFLKGRHVQHETI